MMKFPGKRYWCFVDICIEGTQFCDRVVKQRCRYCSDFADDCFTNQQQQNCTQYCMERWLEEHDQGQGDSTCTSTTAVTIILAVLLGIAVIIIVMQCFSQTVKYYGRRIVDLIRSKCCTTTIRGLSQEDYTTVSVNEDNREEAEGIEDDANRRQRRRNNRAVPSGNVRSNGQAIHNGIIRSNGERISNANGQSIRNGIIGQNNEAFGNVNIRRIPNDEDPLALEEEIGTGNGVPVMQNTTQASVYSNHDHTLINRQPISGSSVSRDRAHNVENVQQISVPHICQSIGSPRCELSSPISSNGPLAVRYQSPGIDTGYNSTHEDLDQTDPKESRFDRHSETEGNINQMVQRGSQQVDNGLQANLPLTANENQIEDGRIEPASTNSMFNTLPSAHDLQEFAAGIEYADEIEVPF